MFLVALGLPVLAAETACPHCSGGISSATAQAEIASASLTASVLRATQAAALAEGLVATSSPAASPAMTVPSCCAAEHPAGSSPAPIATATQPGALAGTDPSSVLGIPTIVEKLGAVLPIDKVYLDETGRPASLATLLDRPTIVCFVFYTCPSACNLLMSGVVDVVRRLNLVPGKDFNIVSLSIDERDTAATIGEKRREFLSALGSAFPADAWRFFRSDKATIEAVTGAAGFGYKRGERTIIHPVGLVITAPGGKIVRYLHGNTFLPLDLTLALSEAAEGKVGVTVQKMVSLCFSYDPTSKKYVFNVMRVAGVVILLVAGLFWLFLFLKPGKPITPAEKRAAFEEKKS